MICLMVQSVVFFSLSMCFVHTGNILPHCGPLSLGQGRKLLWLVKRVVFTFYDSPTKNPLLHTSHLMHIYLPSSQLLSFLLTYQPTYLPNLFFRQYISQAETQLGFIHSWVTWTSKRWCTGSCWFTLADILLVVQVKVPAYVVNGLVIGEYCFSSCLFTLADSVLVVQVGGQACTWTDHRRTPFLEAPIQEFTKTEI